MSQLNWMPVSESYDEADGALMPGLVVKHGTIARIGDGEVFMEVCRRGRRSTSTTPSRSR